MSSRTLSTAPAAETAANAEPAPAAFLKTTRAAAGRAVSAAMAARATQGLAGIAFAWLLSGLIARMVFDRSGLGGLAAPTLLLAVLALLRAALFLAAERAAQAAGAAVRHHLFERLLDHAARLGPVRLAGDPTGELAALMTDAVAGTDPYWRRWMPALAQAGVLPPAILLIALPMDWKTGLVLVATLPLLPVFMVLAGKAAEQASRRQWASLTRLGGQLLDSLRGLADLKILNAAVRAVGEVAARAEAYRRDTMSVLRLAFLSALVLEFFATLSIAVVAVLAGFRLMWGELDFRTGFFLLLLAPEFYAPLRQLGTQRHARMEAEAAGDRIAAFLARGVDLPPRPQDNPAPGPRDPNRRPFEHQPADLSAIGLTFEEVGVVHEDGRVALDRVSFSIGPGEHVALTGESGAGKSTILALLAGFIAPTSGRILVNGTPLDRIDPREWRRHLVHLPQRPHLFEASLAENVAMGRPGGERRIRAALAEAGADTLLARLPGGLETRLGDNGLGLSGGEAQRLALARAFHHPAPLILADEPTAHLDPATEALIGAAMTRLGAGRTMVTVAHRPDTIRRAGRVLVFAGGRLAQDKGASR